MTSRQAGRVRAFTLVELLVSMAILLLMLVVLVGMVNQTSNLWRGTNGRIEQFRQAREGFEAMTRRLSQATLNTYLDYVDKNGNSRISSSSTFASVAAFVPNHYARQSELRFLTGPTVAGSTSTAAPRPTHAVFFQAPLGFVADTTDYGGLNNLLNTWGYYVEFNNDGANGTNSDGTGLALKPGFVKSPDRYRFRLMELMQPSEALSLYKYTASNPGLLSTDAKGENWFMDPLTQTKPSLAHVLAENIVALVILPKLSPGDQAAGSPSTGAAYTDGALAPLYGYDTTLVGQGAGDPNLSSHNQLPPLVTVTMVAVDETSYARFQATATALPTNLALDKLFQAVGDTKDPTKGGFAQDLQALESNLQAARVNYRVFTTDVSIKGAKWSRTQTN